MGKSAKTGAAFLGAGAAGLPFTSQGREFLFGTGPQEVGQANLMTPEQQQFLASLLPQLQGQAEGAFPGLLQGFSEENFQKGVVDPALRTYRQDILPEIEGRFADAGASSALNQALARSSEDLSSIISGQRIGYQGQQQQAQLGALGQILSLLGQRAFQPIIQGPQQGILGDLLSTGARAGAAYFGGGF